jgi:hypothetical protein
MLVPEAAYVADFSWLERFQDRCDRRQFMSMIKIYTDFNDKTAEGGYWILQHAGTDLAEQVDELGLSAGDRVLLFQDPDDFEVEAVLDFKFVDAIGRETWLAIPNWATIKRRFS